MNATRGTVIYASFGSLQKKLQNFYESGDFMETGRFFICSLLLSICFVFSVKAQEAVRNGLWSDDSTWSEREVPQAGGIVNIGDDVNVVLDVSTPELSGITINGKLSFSDESDIELTTEWILVFGELEIGTEDNPHTSNATITLTDNVKDEQLMGMGDRGIMLSGGTLNLHGNRTNTWTKLAQTAEAGSKVITVLNADQWQVGDEIVLASTDYNPRQAETRFISAIKDNTITLDEPLEYMHFGEITFGVDERGEVGLLTRNIKIQSSEDSLDSYFGGHIMAMITSKMYVDSIELNRMGQHMELARYPVHWHLVGEGGEGQYIKNSAIHDTFNRCVTVHGTNDLRVENNVAYNSVGHCFFMEDGIETGNAFVKNLAIQVKCHPTLECVPYNLGPNGEIDDSNRQGLRRISQSGENTLLPSDNTVAAYWITNPDNTYRDNVAAGSEATGFWFSLPEHPNGAFLDSEESLNTWPRRTPLREFRGNVSHSNYDGFMFDRNINVDNTFDLSFTAYTPLEDPADPYSEMVESHFEDLTAYKNRHGGFWGRGELHVFSNAKLADNAIGMTHSTGTFGSERFTSRLIDSLVVGETDNIGNPATPEEVAYGRSLPKPLIPDFPIRGYEYYDYRHEVVDTTFVNYQDNDQRKTGALSWLLFTGAGVTTENTVSGAQFANAKPVFFPNIDDRFDSDNRGAVAYRSLAIHDLDGSVGGMGNAYILLHDGENDSVATDAEACKIKPAWNASVCPGDVGRLYFRPAQVPAPVAAPGALRGGFGFGFVRPTFSPPSPGATRPAPPPPPAPIALVRDGKEHKITANQSTVRAGTEMQVLTDRESVSLSLSEMDQGSWIMFELPGFTRGASGTEQGSLDALRNAEETSWFRDADAVWVKLVVAEPLLTPIRSSNMQATITVSR
ncbi:MAG: transmembrane domain-containing protein [Gammaproteobacteria bacterium]|nr:transmembrane domain-containing protein [Gammaproteobacteria bacterium]